MPPGASSLGQGSGAVQAPALNLVMLGPPGAGKGTQAERVARERRVPRISTGDILRAAVVEDTEVGRAVRVNLDAGQLVSDEIVIAIVKARLSNQQAGRGFVLDGFPRTAVQAIALDRMMSGRDPLTIVNLVVPEDELMRRLMLRRVCSRCGVSAGSTAAGVCSRCGGELVRRSDDAGSVIRERLRVHASRTQPIVDHYRPRLTYRQVMGDQSPDRVAADLRAAVESVVESAGAARDLT